VDRAIFTIRSDEIESFGTSSDGKTIMLKTAEGIDTLEDIEVLEFLDGEKDLSNAFIGIESVPLFLTHENGVDGYIMAQRFLGDPSLNLSFQIIDENNGAVLQGSDSNDFIKLAGSGNKASNGMGGDDVLDGGVGSAFLTGGGVGETDTFFLDGRTFGDAWSTITDFDIGTDKLTIWGWREGVSSVHVVSEFDGAEGYQGLTLSFENLINDSLDGQTTDGHKLVTLSGISAEDFGSSSLDNLNAQIQTGHFDHMSSGSVTDTLGDHGFWQMS
jgi:serralysin